MNYYHNAMKYFGKHPDQNAFTHLMIGVGAGFLLAYPTIGEHPIRWGGFFLLLGVVSLVWAAVQKVK